MILSTHRDHLSRALDSARSRGFRVGLVPTMGFLHEGHLSLVDQARKESDFVAVSIFVNPLQFGPGEDLDRYPRDLQRDLSLLRSRGADLVFCPSDGEMYPDGEPQVTVDPGPLAERLCGAYRPGHFAGVLTVVARLFGLFRPDVAVFGQKDIQQAVLIRQMVEDLEMGVEIALGPIVREADGLAMSSRNVLLSEEERPEAAGLFEGLQSVLRAFLGGEREGAALRRILLDELGNHLLLNLQYAEVVSPETLEPVGAASSGSVVVLAAYCGPTRLIDNHILTR
ncbi:MAG: pantoate--beta-alanine ligase [Gemmatimonadetes bacterium]|nr:pantoate--beta-alanine ligase [Gemmatimonadota bacterium]